MDRRLSLFPPFRDIAEESRAALERSAVVRRYRVGEPLYREGEAPDEVLGLVKGRIKVGRTQENGVAVTLDVLAAGDIAGLVGALLERPHTMTATALSPVVALSWRASLLLERMAEDAALSVNVSRMLTERLRAMADLVEEQSPLSVEPRLARVLLRMGARFGEQADGLAVEVPVTQGDLAELARTTVPTVSRVIGRWRERGIVASHRGLVVLRDRDRLVAVGRDLG